MRIAFVTHQFFPAFYTGVERLTLNLASQLRRMGHECLVLTSADHANGRHSAYAYDDVWVRTVRANAVDLARPWLQDRIVVDRVTDILRDERVDVMHVMHPMRLPQAFEAAERVDVPVVAHVSDFVYLCPRLNLLRVDDSRCTEARGGTSCVSTCRIESGHERFAWGRALLSRAAAVVSPCRWTIEKHAAEGFETSDWHHVPWGVDYAHHPHRLDSPRTGELVLGFAGTLLKHKGPHVLVDAVRRLHDRPIRVHLYGASFHEEEYERELRTLAGNDQRVEFAGNYEHREFASILSGLDAVVIPSIWYENLPTTGLNAIASGVPLLVSDVGGLQELIDDYRCGFAFATGDAGALAGLLDDLIDRGEPLAALRETMLLPPSLEEEAWRIEGIYRGALACRRASAQDTLEPSAW